MIGGGYEGVSTVVGAGGEGHENGEEIGRNGSADDGIRDRRGVCKGKGC